MLDQELKKKFFSGFNKLKNESLWKGCFHEDENCSEDIIKAHSIQNNRILNYISEDGHVLTIGNDLGESDELLATMKQEGRKKATTFTGFCGHHDGTIFRPIEEFEYVKGNKEQEFLFAYRALAKEYHSKKSTAEISRKSLQYIKNSEFNKLSGLFDGNNEPTQDHINYMKSLFEANLFGTSDAEERLELYKIRMNNFLATSQFDKIVTDVIEFNEEFHIALSGLTNIEKDLIGNVINNLADFETALAPLMVTVFPQNGKTYILLSYFERNKRRYKFLKEQILNKDIQVQKVIISNLIINYFENFVVSPIRWRGLTEEQQNKILKQFIESAFQMDKDLILERDINIFI